ncbi:MAG TPA: phosphatase PAP2 family protein [Actinomycetota bacterium]|nr:phosphatase PAP2 family protein [Actinomycetota bacterium]
MLTSRRRTLLYAVVLVGTMAAIFLAVGTNTGPTGLDTRVGWVGRLDESVFRTSDDIRTGILTGVATVLDVAGGGIVTIPFRALVAIVLLVKRRWPAFSVWILTWAFAEAAVRGAKVFFARPRPPMPLVSTTGFSFPSGHAVATASIAMALVLVLMPPGRTRRKWEILAIVFTFVMALSRVYLRAHWLSDVEAGVLLGAIAALAAASVVTEVRDVHRRRRSPDP